LLDRDRYRAKGALRDVGKALGLTEDLIKLLSSQVWGWSEEGAEPKHAEELNLNLEDRRLKLAIALARELIGTPRHLSQHPGGFVLTHDRLDELVPIEPAAMPDRQVIEWDKDDIDALKFMKVDCLAQLPGRGKRHRTRPCDHPLRGSADLRHDPEG
jgi:error-prone DNA polymerase